VYVHPPARRAGTGFQASAAIGSALVDGAYGLAQVDAPDGMRNRVWLPRLR
jgi:hypothetical protein